jgi:hypothetical protein
MTSQRELVERAASDIADTAMRVALAHAKKMHPDAAGLLWSNTHQAAREQLNAIYSEAFDAGTRFERGDTE